MEYEFFDEIRMELSAGDEHIKPGKMMSSEAITYNKKVFAFFSRKKKMVFKLGKDFNPDNFGIEISVFNPFNKRAPLNGWFEVPFTEKSMWKPLTKKALENLKREL